MQSCRAEPQLGLIMIRDSSSNCNCSCELLTYTSDRSQNEFMELARKEACKPALPVLYIRKWPEFQVLTRPFLLKSALRSTL